MLHNDHAAPNPDDVEKRQAGVVGSAPRGGTFHPGGYRGVEAHRWWKVLEGGGSLVEGVGGSLNPAPALPLPISFAAAMVTLPSLP
jgi:hypothetical protein